MTTIQLKAKIKQKIDAQMDDRILRKIDAVLDLETAGNDPVARVLAGERAIAEGRYRTPDEARANIQESIKRKYGK